MAAWRKVTLLVAAFILFADSSIARPQGFYIERLPKGKDVTLPIPATTFVPLAETVLLTSTDMPQSVSFKAVNVGSGAASSIRVAIYDAKAAKVHYADIKPGTPYLYQFRDLSSITIVPGLANGSKNLDAYKNIKLKIESNKSLSIAH
jgi:hypothetical protein